MEETAIPLHSWFWLVVPMSVVFLLSIVNYLRHRTRTISKDHTENPGKSADQKIDTSSPANHSDHPKSLSYQTEHQSRPSGHTRYKKDTQGVSGKKPSSG